MILNNLGMQRGSGFTRSGALEDLELAIRAGVEAVAKTPRTTLLDQVC